MAAKKLGTPWSERTWTSAEIGTIFHQEGAADPSGRWDTIHRYNGRRLLRLTTKVPGKVPYMYILGMNESEEEIKRIAQTVLDLHNAAGDN